MSKTLLQRVEESLDSIRPYLQTDGGDIEVVEITDDLIVKVRLLGACETCPVSYMTMRAGVQESLKRDVPELNGVEALDMQVPSN